MTCRRQRRSGPGIGCLSHRGKWFGLKSTALELPHTTTLCCTGSTEQTRTHPGQPWSGCNMYPPQNFLALSGLCTFQSWPFLLLHIFRRLFKTWMRKQCSGSGISRSCVLWNAFSAHTKEWNHWNPKPCWWLFISWGIFIPVPNILEMARLRNVKLFFAMFFRKKKNLMLQCFESFIGGRWCGKSKYQHMNNVWITKRGNINWVIYFYLSLAHCTFLLFPAQQDF